MEMDKRPRFKRDTVAKEQVTRRFQRGFFYKDIEDCRVQHAGQQDRAHLTLQGQSVGIHHAMRPWGKRGSIGHA